MFHLRYICHNYGERLSRHTSVAVQKQITFIDITSTMFCSNVIEVNCNFEL